LLKWIVLGTMAVLVALVVACGDDDETTNGGTDSPTNGATDGATNGATDGTSTADEVCDQKDAVASAVADLADIDVLAEGTDALNASVENVKTELSDLKAAVSDDAKDEVEDLETAVSDAEETLSGITDDSTLNQRIDAVQSALTGIATASTALVSALENEC
jgi:signal transduction protein with GAF and PtsI domain